MRGLVGRETPLAECLCALETLPQVVERVAARAGSRWHTGLLPLGFDRIAVVVALLALDLSDLALQHLDVGIHGDESTDCSDQQAGEYAIPELGVQGLEFLGITQDQG